MVFYLPLRFYELSVSPKENLERRKNSSHLSCKKKSPSRALTRKPMQQYCLPGHVIFRKEFLKSGNVTISFTHF